MGEVLRAFDTVLGRTVAIKVLPPDLASRPGFVERFRGEAKAAARLSHPNVVQVHDWGETDSTYYMVMEYVRGKNLREIVAASETLAPRQVCELMIQILEGLEAAHRTGLVHRDIKPENILVTFDGRAKVADFGIARVVEAATTGELLGTVSYVAPEHAGGGPVDARSDLYSAGCLMYELLTGALPFEGDAAQVLNRHLNDRVPPPSHQSPDAAPLDGVVSKATERDPSMRYANASEMKAALEEVLPQLEAAPPLRELTGELTSEIPAASMETAIVDSVQKRRRRIAPIALLGLLLVLAVAAAAYAFLPVGVPGVAGLNEQEAQALVVEAGLSVESRYLFADDPPGTVVRSEPAEGERVRRGRTVVLFVSRGPAVSDLADLRGRPLEEAEGLIEEAGLILGQVTDRHDPALPGTVLEQSPEPGRIMRGTPVNLVVSKGPEMVSVPEVTGKSWDEARTLLAQAGLEPVREDVFNDAPEGTVVGQNPAVGETVAKGTPVTFTVSKGPEPFAMPDVRGKACSEAKAELESLGLVVTVRSRSGGCGSNKVLSPDGQDPPPGTTVRKGQEAIIYVA